MTLPKTQTDNASSEAGPVPVRSLSAKTRRIGPKLLGLAIWLALLAAYCQYTRANGVTPLAAVQHLIAFMGSSGAGMLVYVLAYMRRPVLFFPATLLCPKGCCAIVNHARPTVLKEAAH